MKLLNAKNSQIKISVAGLGKSGIACANLAASKGYKVFASDSGKKRTHMQMKLSKKVETEFGGHSDRVLEADIIIKSPGLSPDLHIFREAEKRNIPVMSELDFALNFMKPKKIIAVTGTNGKTTTVTLIHKIIKNGYKNTVVAGNIGFPVSSVVNKVNSDTILVLELSSYQLEDTPYFAPDISVSMNITPDHLQHHKTMKNYIKAKSNIFINQNRKSYAVYNASDKYLKKEITKTKAAAFAFNSKLKNSIYYDNGTVVINDKNKIKKFDIKVKIPGKHNKDNILASAAAAYFAGIKKEIIQKTINSFKGVEHRIEFVREFNGIKFYNDSKSTNVDSAKVALESFDKNIQLILGGRDKGSPYKPVIKLIKNRVKNIFLIGEATPVIEKELKGTVSLYRCGTLQNAVKKICSVSEHGDIALFSPACASFDQFDNFEHRGRIFKKIVMSLK